MNDKKPMSKQRLIGALSRFDPVVKEHGLGGPDLYMVSIPQSITACVLKIFKDQIPEDDDTRVIRDAMSKLYYVFEEDEERLEAKQKKAEDPTHTHRLSKSGEAGVCDCRARYHVDGSWSLPVS